MLLLLADGTTMNSLENLYRGIVAKVVRIFINRHRGDCHALLLSGFIFLKREHRSAS